MYVCMYMYGLRFGVTARGMMAVTISVLLLAEKKNSAQFKIKYVLAEAILSFCSDNDQVTKQ